MYLCLRHGAPAPIEYIEWDIAERFGWALDYINSLPLGKIQELIEIDDARSKARKR